MHITSYLYDEDTDRLGRFAEEARKHFLLVQPVMLTAADQRSIGYMAAADRIIAFVLYTKDGGNSDDLIYTLPEAALALSGILERDIEIVSAWEGASEAAQRVWSVAGMSPVPRQ